MYPIYGVSKKLIVQYIYRGQQKTIESKENMILVIDERKETDVQDSVLNELWS